MALAGPGAWVSALAPAGAAPHGGEHGGPGSPGVTVLGAEQGPAGPHTWPTTLVLERRANLKFVYTFIY